ncbi:cytochrome c peroxidase [soil metagenome]
MFVVLMASAFMHHQPPHKLTYLKLVIPKGWPQPPTNIFATNPLTEEGFQLGRKLFYDARLSKDSNFSCAGCHQQFAAFATYDHDFSHGFNNSFTTRNAPGIFNIAWQKELHWDGGINHIEVQPLSPLTAINEMATTLPDILKKLKADTAYVRLFKTAFADGIINSQHMLKALAQFTGSIQSYNSKYDKVKRGEDSFTVSEALGYKTFMASCNGCHKEPLFTDNSFRNNGLSLNKKWMDKGRMTITGNPADSLKFKVPSLRNSSLTFPYMHDGRLVSLGKVIDHYRNGIDTTQPTLDPLLKKRIPISDQEKVDLISFLLTLKDDVLTHDVRFKQPN